MRDSRGLGAAALVVALGGATAVAGALLPWIQVQATGVLARVTGGAGLDVKGTSLLAGKVALIGGLVLIGGGVALWVARSGDARRWLAVLSVVGGALVIGVAVAAFQNGVVALLRDALGDVTRGRTGGSPPFLRGGRLGALRGLQALAPSHGSGVYLALTGGIVALLGAIAAVFWSTQPVGPPVTEAAVTPVSPPEGAFSKGRAV